MLEEPPLLSIKRPSRRPTEAQIAIFRNCPTSVAADATQNVGVFGTGIRPLKDDLRIAGPALTAGCGPADNLALNAAQAFVSDGDIVVATVDGHQGAAVLGDMVAGRLKNGGAAAFVTDGPIRDASGVLATGLPVWCTGRTPASPYTKGPGTVGLPIAIGGVSVSTGDMIVADGDGIVVVPFADIERIAARVRQILDLEGEAEARVASGQTVPDHIVALLASDQVRWID